MRTLSLALLLAPLLAACGTPTCQSTCARFYNEDQCDAAPEGRSREDVLAECIQACNDVLDVPGPEPDPTDPRFDPNRIPQPVKPVLENERDAAAWMDCVWSIPDDVCRTELEISCARVP